jgi:hypothetical protein
MTIPGFTAAASLYETRFHYVTLASSSSGGIVPQLSVGGLAPPQLEVCRFLCEVCRYYPPYGCFACWYCAIIIILGGERA